MRNPFSKKAREERAAKRDLQRHKANLDVILNFYKVPATVKGSDGLMNTGELVVPADPESAREIAANIRLGKSRHGESEMRRMLEYVKGGGHQEALRVIAQHKTPGQAFDALREKGLMKERKKKRRRK